MNFRDLGGLPTEEGVIRERLLFRAGDLAQTTPKDAECLARTLDVRTYLDLRTDADIEREGAPQALVDMGIQWVRLPVDLGDDLFVQSAERGAEAWGGLYVRGLSRFQETWLRLLRILTEAEGGVVFGCVAGKDRTGIAAAMLLTSLGVAEEVIVEDYAKTTAGLAPHVDRWGYLWGDDPVKREQIVADYFTARPDAMRMLMGELREKKEALLEEGLVRKLRQRYVRAP